MRGSRKFSQGGGGVQIPRRGLMENFNMAKNNYLVIPGGSRPRVPPSGSAHECRYSYLLQLSAIQIFPFITAIYNTDTYFIYYNNMQYRYFYLLHLSVIQLLLFFYSCLQYRYFYLLQLSAIQIFLFIATICNTDIFFYYSYLQYRYFIHYNYLQYRYFYL